MGPKGSLMLMPFIFYLHKFWRTSESEAMFRFTKKILFEEEILEILETKKNHILAVKHRCHLTENKKRMAQAKGYTMQV